MTMPLSFTIETMPTLEERISQLEKAVDRIERTLKQMQNEMVPKKEQWVGPTVITGLTGWNSDSMARARRNGSVRYRRNPMTNGYQYLISSIPEHLLKGSNSK
jgi:hypothetical protein